jgi:tetratricopeptide (TPR) repeat protein/CHAT domain-containing protein
MLARLAGLLALIALAVAGPLSPSLSGQAADPANGQTPQERQKLEAQATECFQDGYKAYQRGDRAAAVAKTRESLRIREQLFAKTTHPQGHPDLATSLNAIGFLVQVQGAYGEARGYFERALAMYQSLYPKDRYPQGHAELARSLSNLGGLLKAQGSYDEARGYLERALAMCESLYPKDRYPQGHPHLAATLINMGRLLEAQGSYTEARGYYERALAMFQSFYLKDRYPQGHPDLATSLNAIGFLVQVQGSYGEARGYFERALAMYQSLYPKNHYPRGHPDLAASLSTLGYVLQAEGSYAEARGYFERALAMNQSLYPKDRYPQGHPYLATSLNNMGAVLQAHGSYGEARGYYERELAMLRSLYPEDRHPQGHPNLAGSLNNLGLLLRVQGSYGEARACCERALAMRQSLYPKDRHPRGHPDVAQSLNNLGLVLHAQGSFAEAGGYYERALAMYESLYPKDQYPHGNVDLAASLSNLCALLQDQGSYGEARGYCERALAMRQSLYPKDRYPRGHSHLANSLDSLGVVLDIQGSYGEARGYHERALAMRESLYPKDRYRQGHPDLAISLGNLGWLLQAQGSYGEARGYSERALDMFQSLYPKESYARGHPDLAKSLNNLGFLLQAQGSYGEAAVFLREAADRQHGLSRTVLAAVSEAEAMDYMARLPLTSDCLISVSLRVPDSDDETYRRVWNGKFTLTQILRDRQAAAIGKAGTDPSVRRTVLTWRDARAGLARLILATADGRDHPERAAMIKALGAEKERLERDLAAAVPEFGRKRALEQSRHDDLLKVLPDGTAVIELMRFTRFEQDPQTKGKKGERQTPSYVGFVLSKGQPVRMVDLGRAEPIDAAVSGWRQAIVHTQESPAAADLRRLVWQPLARHVPIGTTTLFLVPDGELCYIPWAALPGDQPGTVILEQYALGIVPHAPFLLERLSAPKPAGNDSTAGLLLAVGGVAYGREPKPVDDEQMRRQLLAARPAEIKRGGPDGWRDLPGTLHEIDSVSRLAARREIVRLQAAEAGTGRLLQELPRARWAHIATHGYFADPSIRSVLTPDPKLFNTIGTERIGAGLRNPLVLSGLVLAGANVPRAGDDLLAHDDHGILTAESIAGLDLSGLDLVVLSACETGLGLSGGGEGVFGLQRAFHLAGAQNVVASLWKVDDHATAALMTIFYDRLWRQGKLPIEALREAQLALYHNPELAGKLARARGTPDFDKLVQLPEPGPSSAGSSSVRHAPTRQWAAFVLSGYGR